MGDSIDIDLGYQGGGIIQKFTGYVKRVEREYPDGVYVITAQDVLVRAVDYFIASNNPDNPLKYSKISGEGLVRNLLQEAGITNFGYEPTHFTYAVHVDAEINLVGCYDMCKQIADMLAWHIYADGNGKVWFVDRKPYLDAGDTSSKTITHPSIISITKTISDDDLRNRIVVYGANGIHATAQASSPYLPAGYYKTAVLSSWYVDTYNAAQAAANYNLVAWNRLRNSLHLTIEGDNTISARDIVRVIDSQYLTIDSDWYVYACEHKVDSAGYTVNLELRQ